MDESMMTYLRAIEAPTAICNRVDELLEAFGFLCPEPIERIFITDILDKETRDLQQDSLWGFSDNYLLEARELTVKQDLDVSPFAKSISYLGVEYKDLKLGGYQLPTAWMSVELETDRRIYNHLSAGGTNCKFLERIVTEIFQPNLRREPR